MMRRITLSVILVACGLAVACATPPAKISQEKPVDEINNQRGLALRGYDPVAYFTEHQPTAGSADITYEWSGATYRFASVAHRDLFQVNPAQYAPQFGGYCAYAVSLGTTADGDPFQWAVEGNRLFVNNNAIATRLWNRRRSDNIRLGVMNWLLIPKQPVTPDASPSTDGGPAASADSPAR